MKTVKKLRMGTVYYNITRAINGCHVDVIYLGPTGDGVRRMGGMITFQTRTGIMRWLRGIRGGWKIVRAKVDEQV